MSSIFIPLTFVAGVYGMNFKYMPELEWSYGYPAIMLSMFLVAVALLVMFRRKEWL
jgi:magnesium transporter